MTNESPEKLKSAVYYSKRLAQLVYLLFKLHLRDPRDDKGSWISLSHKLEGTLQHPRAKTNSSSKNDEWSGQICRWNGNGKDI